MKKALFLFLALPILFACDADDPVVIDETKDYTSYVLKLPANLAFETILTGYYNDEGECKLICNHGNWTQGGTTPEFILPEYHYRIYLFFESEKWGSFVFQQYFLLGEYKRNNLEYFGSKAFSIEEKTIYNWPH